MKTLATRSGSYLTGSEIADAVMRYGVALTRRRELDVVNFPYVAPEGVIRRVDLMIGWQSYTATMTHDEVLDELTESHTIDDLNAKAQRFTVMAEPFTDDDLTEIDWPRFD